MQARCPAASRTASTQLRCRPFTAQAPATRRGSSIRQMAIKLYTNPGSRGKICEWTLEELKLPYEAVNLDMRAGEHKRPEYLKVHPFGKVPALQDGDVSLFESGAICLYLFNKYGKLSPDALGSAAQWTLFANSTFCEAFFNGPKPAQQAAMLATLDGLLADPKKPYLTGTEATLADISVGSYLLYLPMFFPDMDLVQYKHMWAYMKRLAARPTCPASYKEAMAKAVEKAEGAGAAGGLMGMLKKVTGGA